MVHLTEDRIDALDAKVLDLERKVAAQAALLKLKAQILLPTRADLLHVLCGTDCRCTEPRSSCGFRPSLTWAVDQVLEYLAEQGAQPGPAEPMPDA